MQNLYPFVWIAFIACIFLMWFFMHRANHKERMMMIERGLDPDMINRKKNGFRFPWRKFACIIIGLGVGLFIISILVALNLLEKAGNALPLAVLIICGGAGMIVGNKSGKDNV